MTVNDSSKVNAADTINFVFGIEDYVVFVAMLAISAGVGVYFGFFSKGADTSDEYLLGGKKMRTLPIAISLVASQLSGIAIMSIPAETYAFGINYIFTVLSMFAVVPVLCYMVIPVFYKNNISNCYEYLQLRFNKEVRQIITATFILTIFLYLPVFMFIPSLAFSQVTGVNIHLINTLVCSICVFYTMLGGIKAVVWTDVIQATIMVGSTILIAVVGLKAAGGFGQVIDKALDGGRLQPNLKFDLTTRGTLWNCSLGGFFIWNSYMGFNQSCVQRLVALPSLSRARKSLYIFGIGFFIIMLLNCFTGVIIFAKYFDCDPIASKAVEKVDKIMPFFVQDIVGHWKGMPGVFISCVFSASLSTISANLNSLSGIVYFDYIKPFVRHSERKANHFMKACVLVFGIYCILGGYIVQQFKSIMQVVVTISGVAHGTVFGIFMLGLLVPRVNGKVALVSLISAIIGMLCIVFGAQMKVKAGELTYEPLPTSIEGCQDFNITLSQTPILLKTHKDDGFSIFEISFYWYAVLGGLFVWIVALPMSYLCPSNDKLDPKLLAPVFGLRSVVKLSHLEQEVPLKKSKSKIQTQLVQ